MSRLARRVAGTGESATFAVRRAAAELRAQGAEIIDLSVGEPHFATPKLVVDATVAALEQGHTRYTATLGIPELRTALAERYSDEFGGEVRADRVAVTAGAKQGLYNLFMATLDPGDEVIVPTPCWVSIPPQLRLAGAAPQLIPCQREAGFLPDPADIERAITPRTRALVVNSPSNPTGVVVPRDSLAALVKIAVKNDLLLISDETYEYFTYGEEFVSAGAFHEELGERLVIVGSFSKSYAMPGLRLGWVLGPTEVIDAIGILQGHMTSNAASIVQYGVLAATEDRGAALKPHVEQYRRRRDEIVAALAAIDGFDLVAPGGAIYAFPGVRGLVERFGVAGSIELAELFMRQAGVAVVPGDAFEAEGFVRLSFAVPQETLAAGLARLAEFVGR